MRIRRLQNPLLLSIACCTLLLAASTAQAAVTRSIVPNETPKNRIRTSPPRVELDVAQGQTVKHEITIYNESPVAQDISLKTTDYGPSSDPRSLGTRVENAEFGAGDWITPEVNALRLAPFEQVSLDIAITAPVDAPTGTSLGALLVRSAPAVGKIGADDAIKSGGTAIVIDAIMQVFITVPGNIKHDAKITSISTRDAFVLGSTRIVVWDITIENSGTVNEHVEGVVDVRSIFGTRADRIKVPPLIVLRGSKRTTRVVWRDAPWVGSFYPQVKLRSDDARKLEARGPRITFLPWWVIPSIALLILLPTLWIWIQRNREQEEYLDEEYSSYDQDSDW